MNNALRWLKSNPITLAAALLTVVAIGFIVYVVLAGFGLEERMAERKTQIDALAKLRNQTIQLPAEDPDKQPEDFRGITINAGIVERVKNVHDQMSREFREIFQYAIEINEPGHELILPNLLPGPAPSSLKLDARGTYRQAFVEMLQAPTPDTPETAVRLDAGQPLPFDQVQVRLDEVQRDFSSPAFGDNQQLGENERETLRKRLRETLIFSMNERAKQIHLYAETDINSPDFPFDVGAWSVSQSPASMDQLWEAQLELWIQQDIARAIALANDVGNAESNVLNAPIKRLLRVDVLPGYVGLHTLGGVVGGGVAAGASASGGGASSFDTSFDFQGGVEEQGGGPGPMGASAAAGIYSAPEAPPAGPDQPISANFYTGPSGRVSNSLFDVRHVRVEMIADAQQLPIIFEAFAKVNLMTVLEVEITDIDEYDAIRDGYLYGPADAVKADLIIETIWLRDWTQQLMPEVVRQYLGIGEVKQRESEAASAAPTGGFSY